MIKPDKKFWDVFRNTNGALSCAEAVAIMNIAAKAPEGNYLEMGTHKGKSAQAALCGLKGKNKFFLLEPEFTNQDFLDETIHGINKVCVIANSHVMPVFVPEYSTDFIPKFDTYTYVFSDAGSHQDGLPMQEVKMLEDKILPGGIIAFHDWDSQFKEVKEASDYLVGTGKYEYIPINWDEIISYVNENNLEDGNESWHHRELQNPCFVGAVKRK